MTATLDETDLLTVQGDPIARTMDGESRWYHHPLDYDQKYISVTTVLSASNSKPWLMRWAVKYAAEYAVTQRSLVGRIRHQGGDDAAIRAIVDYAESQRNLKADLGSFWHEVIERLVLDGTLPVVPDHLEGRVVEWGGEPVLIDQAWLDRVSDGFLQFVTDFEFQPVMSEVTVASDEHRAAGTLDLMGRLRCFDDARLALIDTKSGKNLYVEAVAQLAALRAFPHAWLRDGRIVRKPRADLAAVLHLRPEYGAGYKLQAVTDDELAAGWAWWRASLENVRAAEAMPKRFGHALYPPLPDGSQPPPMVEDLRSYSGVSRAIAPLLVNDIKWLHQIAVLSRADLLGIKGVGEKTVDALAAVLAEFGLSFADDERAVA